MKWCYTWRDTTVLLLGISCVIRKLAACLTLYSTKMYKTRIKKWGLTKNFKRNEALAMLALLSYCQPKDVLPVFFIRGRKITHPNLQRYVSRAHITSREVCSIQPSSVRLLAPDLECVIPEAMPHYTTAPDQLYRSESLIHALSSYLDGAFEANVCWERCFAKLDWSGTSAFQREGRSLLQEGLGYYRCNRLKEAVIQWRYGFLRSECLIDSPDPLDWLSWVKGQSELTDAGLQSVAFALRNHIVSLAAIKMRASCLQHFFVKSLCSLDQQNAAACLSLLCAVVHRTYQAHLHPVSLIHETYRLSLISGEEYTKHLHDMLGDIESHLAPSRLVQKAEHDEITAVTALTTLVIGIRKFVGDDEAVRLLQKCLTTLENSSPSVQKEICKARSHYMLGAIRLDAGLYELAREELVECLNIDERCAEIHEVRVIESTALAGIYRALDDISTASDIANGDLQWRLKIEVLHKDWEEQLAEAVGDLRLDTPL